MRFGNIEARWSPVNKKYEIVEWGIDGKTEHCWVIAFVDIQKEGYDMRTVGERYHKASGMAHVVAKHALAILNELHDSEEWSSILLDRKGEQR